jgi:hypothetical protein
MWRNTMKVTLRLLAVAVFVTTTMVLGTDVMATYECDGFEQYLECYSWGGVTIEYTGNGGWDCSILEFACVNEEGNPLYYDYCHQELPPGSECV